LTGQNQRKDRQSIGAPPPRDPSAVWARPCRCLHGATAARVSPGRENRGRQPAISARYAPFPSSGDADLLAFRSVCESARL